jgi:hypothetical protein
MGEVSREDLTAMMRRAFPGIDVAVITQDGYVVFGQQAVDNAIARGLRVFLFRVLPLDHDQLATLDEVIAAELQREADLCKNGSNREAGR